MIVSLNLFVGGFLQNTVDYPSRPDEREIREIQWIEEQVLSRSTDFLHDPTHFSMRWEDLTEEEFPQKYLDEFPLEIDGYWIGQKGKGVKGICMKYLPIVDAIGKVIKYPEERLVAPYLEKGQHVYILKENMMNALQAA